jgi:FMN reductase
MIAIVAEELTIVGLGGSRAEVSASRGALRVALEGAAVEGAATSLLDLRELGLPMYDPDREGDPGVAASLLAESCYGADGLVWSSPMYQGTISGAFKNALDWLHVLGRREPPFLHDKVVGLISVAGGTQGLQAINTMEFAVRALRAWAVPYVVPIAASRAFEIGRLRDEAVAQQLRTLGGEVVRVARLFSADPARHRPTECDEAAVRVASG